MDVGLRRGVDRLNGPPLTRDTDSHPRTPGSFGSRGQWTTTLTTGTTETNCCYRKGDATAMGYALSYCLTGPKYLSNQASVSLMYSVLGGMWSVS